MVTSEIFFRIILPNLFSTMLMVGLSSIFSVILGFALSVALILTNKNGLRPNRQLYQLLDLVINVIRSMPFIILMVALMPFTRSLVGTTIGTWAAIVPLTFSMTPYMARLFESNLLEVKKEVVEAAQSFGASNLQIIFKVMLVEALPSMVSSLTLAIIAILGSTAMAGTVGAGGLGAVAITYGYQNFNDKVMYSTVIVLILLVQFIQMMGSFFYKRLKYEKRKK